MALDKPTLQRALNLGITTYLTAYVNLMALELDLDPLNQEQTNAMGLLMLDVVNLGTEVAWRAIMNDHEGVENGLERFREYVEALYDD